MKKKSEWARVYGSPERVRWVAQLNCVACGELPCQNAHVKNGGMGRKADARWIVPMCPGCHREHHAGAKTFQKKYGLNLLEKAEEIEQRWQRHKAGHTDLGF